MAPLDEDHVRAKITWSEQDIGGGKLVVEVTVNQVSLWPPMRHDRGKGSRSKPLAPAAAIVCLVDRGSTNAR